MASMPWSTASGTPAACWSSTWAPIALVDCEVRGMTLARHYALLRALPLREKWMTDETPVGNGIGEPQRTCPGLRHDGRALSIGAVHQRPLLPELRLFHHDIESALFLNSHEKRAFPCLY
jgi:hypothetical protein